MPSIGGTVDMPTSSCGGGAIPGMPDEVAGQYLACLLHSEEKMLAQEEEWSIERIQSGIVSSSNIPPSSNSIILT